VHILELLATEGVLATTAARQIEDRLLQQVDARGAWKGTDTARADVADFPG